MKIGTLWLMEFMERTGIVLVSWKPPSRNSNVVRWEWLLPSSHLLPLLFLPPMSASFLLLSLWGQYYILSSKNTEFLVWWSKLEKSMKEFGVVSHAHSGAHHCSQGVWAVWQPRFYTCFSWGLGVFCAFCYQKWVEVCWGNSSINCGKGNLITQGIL